MSDVVPLALAVVLATIGAVVHGPSRGRRALGYGVALCSVVTPWLPPSHHLVWRSCLAIMIFGGFMRATDLLRGSWSLGGRVAHALSIVDTRKLTRIRPGLEVAALARLVGWEIAGATGYAVTAYVAPGTHGALYWILRWGGALVFVYTITEGAYCLIFAGYRLAGFATPPLHRHPALSKSVQEFWGKRWALAVSAWLGETFFRPLARRGHPIAGLILAFFASAVAHAYVAAPSASWAMTAILFAYFCVQGVIVAAEVALGVPRWRPLPARLWTIGWMVGLSPLFTEPLLQVVGI